MTRKHLMSAAAASRELEVDRSTLARWIAAGKVPAFRTPGGQWRVRRVDVDKLKEEMGLGD